MSRNLYIGDDVKNERSVFIGENLRNAHMHIIGRSNTGKTSHLIHMIRKDIVNGHGLCVIDMLGNLYPRLVSFLAYHDLVDRVVLFDPSDTQYAPGLNYLDTFNDTLDPATVLDTAMEGIMRVFREQNESVKPRWETYGPLALLPLIKEKLTLLELFPFVSPDIDAFRKRILKKHKDFYLAHGWQEFDNKTSSSKKFELIEVVYNRGMRFWPNRQVRRIVGQPRNFIDWRQAMDEGKVVLCNLGSTGNVTDKQTQMLGVMLLHQIINAAKTRRGKNPKRFYLYVDEFPQILCKDFETAPDMLRNFNVSLILAHQRMGQLTRELQDIDVGSAVMANARVKEVFNISQEDSELLAKEVFGRFIHGDDIKYQGKRTMLVPRQEIIKLHSRSKSSASGSALGSPVNTYSEGILFDVNAPLDSRLSTGTASHESTTSSHDSSSISEGEHEALRTLHDREYEDETPVFRSIEEKTWEYIRKILSQRQRESILLIPECKPVSIQTPFIQDYHVEDSYVQEFIAKVHAHNRVLFANDVDDLIEERYRHLLGEDFGKFWNNTDSQNQNEPPESDDDRWQ